MFGDDVDLASFVGYDEHNLDQFLRVYSVSITPLVEAVLERLHDSSKVNRRAVAVWIHGLEEWIKKASDGRGGRGVAFPKTRSLYTKLLAATPALAKDARIPRLDKLEAALKALVTAGLVKEIKAPPQKGTSRSSSYVVPTPLFRELFLSIKLTEKQLDSSEASIARSLTSKAYVPVVITEELIGSKIRYMRAPIPVEKRKYPQIKDGQNVLSLYESISNRFKIYLIQPEQPTLITAATYKSIGSIVGPGTLIGEGRNAQFFLPSHKKSYLDLGPEIPNGGAVEIDSHQLRYHRVFSLNWDRGGRYYAPYLSTINSQHRCCMQVYFDWKGYDLADYDLSNLHIRLLYAQAFPDARNLSEILPNEGRDLYDVGLPDSYRSMVKLAMLTATNLNGKAGRLPATLDNSLVKSWPGRQRKQLNRKLFYGRYGMAGGISPSEISPELFQLDRAEARVVREAIEVAHPSIRHLWGQVHGPRLQFMESQILTYVINHMSQVQLPGASQPGIPVLPAHDGAATIDHPVAKRELEKAFRDGFHKVTGIELDEYGLKGDVLQLPRQLEPVLEQLLEIASPRPLHSAS